MFDDTSTITRPSNGVAPVEISSPSTGTGVTDLAAQARPTIAESAPIVPDDNARAQVLRLVQQLDDRQLLVGIDDRRFAGEALTLAVEAFAQYDPKRHHLSHLGADDRQPKEISYPAFFRLVAFDTFRGTRNIGLAGLVLDRLIAERAS